MTADIHRLTFTAEERLSAQAWHDAHDEDDQHLTVNQKVEAYRRKQIGSQRLRTDAAAELAKTPPCPCCGAKAGEPCREPKE